MWRPVAARARTERLIDLSATNLVIQSLNAADSGAARPRQSIDNYIDFRARASVTPVRTGRERNFRVKVGTNRTHTHVFHYSLRRRGSSSVYWTRQDAIFLSEIGFAFSSFHALLHAEEKNCQGKNGKRTNW